MIDVFILGLLTPLTAVCVLPLFPGFIAFLSQQSNLGKYGIALFGLLVSAGVLSFMFLFGLLFSYVFEVGLTKYIGIITPIAMIILILLSILLLLDFDFSKMLPHFNAPESKNPYLSAFLFGFFFAAIVIPCQPSFLTVFFARQFIELNGFVQNMLDFLFFGLGMAAPLLFFALISLQWSKPIISFLTKHKTIINKVTGAIMLVISTYYLFFVFL